MDFDRDRKLCEIFGCFGFSLHSVIEGFLVEYVFAPRVGPVFGGLIFRVEGYDLE